MSIPMPAEERLLQVLSPPDRWYGLTSNTLARKSKTAVEVTGGNEVWGTELQLHNGATIGRPFMLAQMWVTTIGTANRPVIFEFYKGSVATGVACTFAHTTNKVTKAAHGLANGTKVMLSGADIPSDFNTHTVYYVVSTATNDFQLSLTEGGSAITFTDEDKEGSFHVVTQSLLCERVVSSASTTPHTSFPLVTPVVDEDECLWVRGMSVATGTNAVSFYLGVNVV